MRVYIIQKFYVIMDSDYAAADPILKMQINLCNEIWGIKFSSLLKKKNLNNNEG